MDGIIDNSIKIVNGVETTSETATISEEVRQAVDIIIDSAVERVEQQMENVTLSEETDAMTPIQDNEGEEIEKIKHISGTSEAETKEVELSETLIEAKEEIVEEQGKILFN